MSLNEAVIPIRFAGGIETKIDPKAVPPTQLLDLENGVFTRAISIRKRNGYAALQTLDGAQRLATRGDELLAFTANRCYSLTAADTWADAGACFSVLGADRPLMKTGTQQEMGDAATTAGITLVAWEDSRGGVWWSVVDESGRVLRAAAQADAAGIAPRCLVVGGNLHAYFAVPTTRSIYVIVVDPMDPTASVSPVLLVSDLDSAIPYYDVSQTGREETPSVMVWSEHGTTNFRISYVDQSGAIGSPINGHPTGITFAANRNTDAIAESPIAIAWSLERVTIAFLDSGLNARVQPFCDFDLGSFGGYDAFSSMSSDVDRIGVAVTDDNETWVVAEEFNAAPSKTSVEISKLDNSGTIVIERVQRGLGIVSKPFIVDGEAFAVMVHDTTYFNTYVTVRLSDSFPVGRHLPGSAAGIFPRAHLASAHLDSSTVKVTLPSRDRLITETGSQFAETGLRALDLVFGVSHQTAELGRGLYMAGACPLHYDGRAWTEQGFHFGPELISTVNGSGGSLTSSTTYLYRVWYEWTDAQGEVHRGPMSVGTTVTMGGSDTKVTLTLPTLRLTEKTNVRICVGRSAAADTGDDAQMWRVTSLDPTATTYVANDKTVDTATLVDTMSDTTLREQEPVYTVGGVLSNDPIPMGTVIARGKNRLFCTDASDGNAIRYSQELEEGYGAEFAPELRLTVDSYGGDITAIAVQDDRVIAFKETAIYVFAGDGPTVTGDTAQGGFSRPQLITSDVGCLYPESVCLTPNGYVFQSRKGYHLLGRDGSITYVGAPVEAYNSQRTRSATTLPDRTSIVFVSDTGSTLLYDYFYGQWSRFSNHLGYGAAVVGDRYHYLRLDGRVFRETPGEYSDAGQRIRIRFETAWIKLQGHLQGFARFWALHLLGTWLSPHQLGITYRTGYDAQWSSTYWLDATGSSSSTGWITGTDAATIGADPITGSEYGDGEYGDGEYGGDAPDVYSWRMRCNEKGSAIQIRVEDFEAVGYAGASMELSELSITGGVKGNVPAPFTSARGS